MKKLIFTFSIILLFLSIGLFLSLQIFIKINQNKNEKVMNTFNQMFQNQNIDIMDETNENEYNFSKIEIDGTDYIGFLSLSYDGSSIPVESKCKKSFFSIEAACDYSKESFIILGNNLKGSFSSFESYDVYDLITFTNSLNQSFQYRINSIKRVDTLDNLSKYDNELIIAIKNFYDMEYVLLLCDSNL